MTFKKFKTERVLVASIVVLFLFMFASAFTKEIAGIGISSAEETSSASAENEDSGDGNEEDSQDEPSQNEESQNDEKSEPSTASATSVKTMQSTGVNVQEVSEKSLNETSQQSVEAEEVSEVSEPSVASQEISEESIKYVEGYGEVVSKEGNVALVKKDERLFFLIPVEVESQVTLDDQGNVTDSKKSFLNWLLSVLSF